jgi:signal transduction histidine kinase/CheY-like chemotaxis protein
MGGAGAEWQETYQPELTFPSLPSGDHDLQVLARSAGGVWSAEPAVFRFTVRPAWWETPWAMALLLAGAVLAASGAIRWRERRHRVDRERLELVVQSRTRELADRMAEIARKNQEIEQLLVEAQQANRVKSEFLANISHEIRTPMNGIIGLTRMVLDSELAPPQKENLEIALSSAGALLQLLNDVLDLSKMEAGHLVLEPDPFSLPGLIGEVCSGFQGIARRKNLSLRWQVEPDTPEWWVADALRLRQILSNLVGNAVKFTERGGVTVTASLAKGPTLRLTVRDTGIGIAEEQRDAIFMPFRQADGSISRKYGGTGLGLAISRRLVDLMQGQLWVESRLNEGSTFHLTAPATPCAAPRSEPDAAAAPRLRALRILLAEDNPVNQRVAAALLGKRGHEVVVAKHGAEALDLLAHEPFDVVLMDVQMPVMDGLEATRKIREWECGRGRRTPILAFTAHAMKGDRERCLAAGMDDYLTKPVEPRRLDEALAALAGAA